MYGAFRPIGGQVVWSGTPREIRRRQRQGKGGPKVETSTLLRSYAIGICEGPITSVSRIWRNNELVYDVRPTSEILAESAKWLEGKTILLGDWDQMPHPTIEAEEGAANAPAMRGTAVLVVTDEDLTDLRGAIPAYQFEVGAETVAPVWRFTGEIPAQYQLTMLINTNDNQTSPLPVAGPASLGADQPTAFIATFRHDELNVDLTQTYQFFADDVGGSALCEPIVVGPFERVQVIFPAPPGIGSVRCVATSSAVSPVSPRYTVLLEYPEQLVSAEQLASEVGGELIAGSAALLPEIVRSICNAASLPNDRLDVSDLPVVLVKGFATSPEYTAASALLELAKIYFFDPQDADGVIRFIPRGGNFTAILTEDQFVDGESEPEADTTRDSISVPRLLHLTYFDVDGGQGPDKQFSERQISPRVESPTVISTPVVLEAASAAKSIQIQHQVMEEELRGELVFGVSDQYIRLTESDVVVVQYRGRSQRARITKVVVNDGWQQLTCLRDRQSAYNANPQVVPPATVTRPPSTLVGATRFAFMDLPALTQAGDALGYHIATSGEVSAWRGAAVERQEAGGAYELLATDGSGTVMGTLTAALPLASEWYPDESNVLTVQLARSDDELEGVTNAEWLARANAAALMRADGTAEIVQFRNATETSPGVWALSGLQRGRLNSGASAHAIGATFVLLDGSLFVQTGSERLATTLTHRAYSVGNLASSGTPVARTWSGRSQREWPPIIESATRTGDTLAVTWTPRHRFGSDEKPVASTHFDGWQVDATSGGTTRTATVLTPTASLDVTGLANPITVTVRGRNRLAGLGDAATRIIP